MKNYSNTYIFIYASVMVIFVAILLSFTAVSLKPLQDKNIKNRKMQDILASANIESTSDNVDELFKKYISESFVINIKGEEVEGEAFIVNLKKELKKKDIASKRFAIFLCTNDDGSKNYIIPLRGKGLGGAIWGYIALKDDFNTVIGAIFDHDAETPGLGDKITAKEFQNKFQNKKIFDDEGIFRSLSVIKGAKIDDHTIDAISGGTITCNGVSEMLNDCLANYESYLKNKRN